MHLWMVANSNNNTLGNKIKIYYDVNDNDKH